MNIENRRMAGEGEGSVSAGVGVGGGSGGGDESGASSPKNKVKFLCSHGGKVLPRPSDGLLKYVGGETRVISVPRTLTFSELMKKLSGMIDGGDNMVLKYQLVPEDLDALVSVRNDEDLKHMIEEHDRHESGGIPMLRAFLFPSKPVVVENQGAASEAYVLEQRYIDAINGIIRTSPRTRPSPIRAYCTSSTCSSPKSNSNSPDGHTAELVPESSPFHASHSGRLAMHRVRSSPSITSLNNLHTLTIQQQQQQHHDHHSHHYHNQSQSQSQSHHQHPPPSPHLAAYPASRTPPQDPQVVVVGGGIGMGRPPPIMSLGKTDISNRINNGCNYYYSTSRPPKGYACYDDSAAAYGNAIVERVNSMPQSPRKSIWE